ncbi:MAG: cytochrome c [Saprospiraceae bacterium]|nr:cytochrome c [Saprospiraceae bacterium]
MFKPQIWMVLLGATALFFSCNKNPWRDGEWLYGKQCASCHGPEGKGLGALIPPLAGSDYLGAQRDILPCIVRYGLKDTITVNGKNYTEPMAGLPQLTDIEITNILNYVNNAWGNQNGVYQLGEVRQLLEKCRPE